MTARLPSPGALRGRPIGERGLAALAVAVGVGAGLGAIAFRALITGFTHLFSGHADFSIAGHAANPHVPGLGTWFVVAAPVVGGLLYGPLVARFAPEARGHGVPEVMLAVAERGGRIRPQVPIVKALASAICIGSGGSVGREGPIVQIGSALGSGFGQLLRVSTRHLRLLVACGAAGGISATFNAPLAGVFFALEVILRDFETQSFGVVVLSSVTAAAIGRAVVGSESFLHLPAFQLVSPAEFVLYAALGLLAAVAGVAFMRVLYGSEDLADRLWRGPAWARPAVGGVALGLLLLALPQMYGVGYPVLTRAVEGHYAIAFVLLLLAGKIVATSLTLSIGGSGGVFAPSLFMGAMLGSAFGQAVHAALPHATAPSGAYALVGMGAVFAGSARAPITAVVIIFELTNEYSIILPLMVAVVVATALSRRLATDTIYTLKLRRRGVVVDRPRVASVMQTVTVADAMADGPPTVTADTPLDAIARLVEEGRHDVVWVVDEAGRPTGGIGIRDVEAATIAGDAVTAAALTHTVRALRTDEPLEVAAGELSLTDDPALPAVDADGRLVGALSHRDLLRTYHRSRTRLSGDAPVTSAR